MTQEQATEAMNRLNNPDNYKDIDDYVLRRYDWTVNRVECRSGDIYSVDNTFDRLTFAEVDAFKKIAQTHCYGICAKNDPNAFIQKTLIAFT